MTAKPFTDEDAAQPPIRISITLDRHEDCWLLSAYAGGANGAVMTLSSTGPLNRLDLLMDIASAAFDHLNETNRIGDFA